MKSPGKYNLGYMQAEKKAAAKGRREVFCCTIQSNTPISNL